MIISRLLKVVSEQLYRCVPMLPATPTENSTEHTKRDQEDTYRYKVIVVSESQDLESVNLTSQYWNILQMWWFSNIMLW